MFKLKDLQFEVETASFHGHIFDPYPYDGNWTLSWFLDLNMKQREVDGEVWSPRLYHESIRFAPRRWTDFAGQTFFWDTAFDRETGEPNGALYVIEHEEIPRATLQFVERNGREFRINWTGIANVCWNNNYGENVPFIAETTVDFGYIEVHGRAQDSDASMLRRLALFLEPSDFTQQSIQSGGENMRYSIFKPK